MPTLLHKEKEMNRGKETCVLQQERGEKEVCSVEHFSPELQQLVFLEHSLSGAACVLFHVTYNHPINYMLLFSLPFCMCGNGNTERLSWLSKVTWRAGSAAPGWPPQLHPTFPHMTAPTGGFRRRSWETSEEAAHRVTGCTGQSGLLLLHTRSERAPTIKAGMRSRHRTDALGEGPPLGWPARANWPHVLLSELDQPPRMPPHCSSALPFTPGLSHAGAWKDMLAFVHLGTCQDLGRCPSKDSLWWEMLAEGWGEEMQRLISQGSPEKQNQWKMDETDRQIDREIDRGMGDGWNKINSR